MLLRSIPRKARGLTHQRVVGCVGGDECPRGVVDGDGGVRQAVEEALHAWRDARRHQVESRGDVSGQPKQQVALRVGETQRAGQGLHDLHRR